MFAVKCWGESSSRKGNEANLQTLEFPFQWLRVSSDPGRYMQRTKTHCAVNWLTVRTDSLSEFKERPWLPPQFCFIPPPCLTHHHQFWLKAKQSLASIRSQKTPIHSNQGDVYHGKKKKYSLSRCLPVLGDKSWSRICVCFQFFILQSYPFWKRQCSMGTFSSPVQMHVPKALLYFFFFAKLQQ